MLPYSRPRGAIHSLEEIESLSSDQCILLCVSERTLYILQNWAGLDVLFTSRYATELLDGGYIPVTEDSGLFNVYQEAVEAVQVEVIDMSCTILDYLQAITDALQSMPGSEGWDGIADVPGYETAPYYDPPADTSAPPADPVRCNLSWSFAINWGTAMEELLRNRNVLGVGIIGTGVALIVGILAPPIGAVIEIVVLIVTLLLQQDIETTVNEINEAVEGIACAIHGASDVQQAMAGCASVIDSMPQLNQRTMNILKAAITHNALNQVWAGTYPVTSGAPTDCTGCPGTACPFMEFKNDGDGDKAGSGYLGADGTLRTLTSKYDTVWDLHRIHFASAVVCTCDNYTIELVSLNGYTASGEDGLIDNCAGQTLWAYDEDPDPPAMTTYIAQRVALASDTAFTLSLRISE